jgi:tetratricopeptide (TPR) repeat protein
MRKSWLGLILVLLFTACDDTPKVEDQNEGVGMDEVVSDQPATPSTPSTQNPKLDSLNTYLTSNPYEVSALVARTREYINQKNLKYALADAKAAYDLDSTNTEVLLNWGEINYFFNKTRISRDAWVECARIDKENIDCRLKLAELYHIVGEYEKSLKLAREVTSIDNQNATAYLILGLDYRDGINDTTTAIKYIQKAIDIQDDYFEAIEHMALLYTHKAKFNFDSVDMAITESYYKRMTQLQPDNYWVYYNKGIYYYNLQDWNRCLESLTQASQLKPNDPEVYLTLGMVHIQIDALPEAEDLFTKAIKYSPSEANYRAYYSRGYVNELQGDYTNAVRDYQQAKRFNPTYEPAKVALQRLANQNAE